MRAFNPVGPEFKVSVLKSTVYNFGSSRKYTGLSYKRGLSFVFDKLTGALVSHNANTGAEPAAVLALEVLAREYGRSKLGLMFSEPQAAAGAGRTAMRRARRKAKKARDVARHNADKAHYKARNHQRAMLRVANASKATTNPLDGTRAERRAIRRAG